MHWYADFSKGAGFRCHPCKILDGPFWDDMSECSFYTIQFTDVIEGTIDPSQMRTSVPTYHIFETPIELVDLPQNCYWGDELEE